MGRQIRSTFSILINLLKIIEQIRNCNTQSVMDGSINKFIRAYLLDLIDKRN